MTVPALALAKFTVTLRGGQVVEVFASSEEEAKRELNWIAPALADAVEKIERDDLWFLRPAALAAAMVRR